MASLKCRGISSVDEMLTLVLKDSATGPSYAGRCTALYRTKFLYFPMEPATDVSGWLWHAAGDEPLTSHGGEAQVLVGVQGATRSHLFFLKVQVSLFDGMPGRWPPAITMTGVASVSRSPSLPFAKPPDKHPWSFRCECTCHLCEGGRWLTCVCMG